MYRRLVRLYENRRGLKMTPKDTADKLYKTAYQIDAGEEVSYEDILALALDYIRVVDLLAVRNEQLKQLLRRTK
jgi:hypothetical protein